MPLLSSSEAMTMGKLHKEIGQLIVQSAEDPEKSNSQVIKVKHLSTLSNVGTHLLLPGGEKIGLVPRTGTKT